MTQRDLIRVSRILAGAFTLLFGAIVSAADPADSIIAGQRYTLSSKVLGESRRYLVHLPDRYYSSNNRYPVLILLDGEAHFRHTSSAVDFLAANGRIPEMIVVGVTNTNRSRDMSPMTVTPPSGYPTDGYGGADKFLAFIADELLPTIDRTYRTRPYRVLIGHSFGGLLTMHALQTRPATFNAYLAISPSLWWDSQSLVENMEPFLKAHESLQADLYVTLGNEDQGMLGSNSKLAGILAESAPKGLRWRFDRHVDETHNSVPYRSTHEGLQELFSGWYIHDPKPLYEQSGIPGLEAHYAKVSKRMGYAVPVQQSTTQLLFYDLVQQKRFSAAEALLNKALEWYPEDPVYSPAIMLYTAMNDDTRAIEYATKLIQLAPGSTSARLLLEKHKIDVSKWVPAVTVSKKALESYAGTYINSALALEVSVVDDKLYASTDSGRFELKALTTTTFYFPDVAVKATFQKSARGKVTGALMERPGVTYLLRRN